MRAVLATMVALGLAGGLRAELRELYAPSHCAAIALAPDGVHVAYLRLDAGRTPLVVIAGVEDGSKRAVAIPVDRDPGLSDGLGWATSPGGSNTALSYLRQERYGLRIEWVDSRRFLVATNRDEILLGDSEGGLRKLADPDTGGAAPTQESANVIPPRPRACRVIPTDYADDCILVEAQGSAIPRPNGANPLATILLRISLATGRVEKAGESSVLGLYEYDRRGRARILCEEPAGPTPAFRLAKMDFMQSDASRPLGGALGFAASDRFAASPATFLGHRAYPLGFGYDPNVLYYASDIGRDTYGVYGYDLARHRATGDVFEDPDFDVADPRGEAVEGRLVFDRVQRQLVGVRRWGGPARTFWRDPEIAAVQTELEGKFPRREIELEGWSDRRDRFLFRVESADHSPRYFVYDRWSELPYEAGRELPVDAVGGRTEAFVLTTADGVRVTGSVTQPLAPKVAIPPLVVVCRGAPWDAAPGSFDRRAQALAGMGFMVLTVEPRGAAAHGFAVREALRADPVRGPLVDVRAAMEWLRGRCRFDPKRVAIMGSDFGGYLAFRAAQLFPAEFRCAVCVEAPLSLNAWTESVHRRRSFNEIMADFGPDMGGGAPPSLPKPDIQTVAILPFGTQSHTIEQMGQPAVGGNKAPAPEPLDTILPGEKAPLRAKPTETPDFLAQVRAYYLVGDAEGRRTGAAAREAEQVRSPLLLIERWREAADVAAAKGVKSVLERNGVPAAMYTVPADAANVPYQEMDKVGQFLNLTFYSFQVKIGNLRTLEESP